jgi:thiosulfate/3-mercaptopyruvate sulfurtransferase
MIFNTLISPDIMAVHLNDPSWVIVDCRFDLQKLDWGYEEYQLAHIPRAVYAHLNSDLASAITPVSGRHPLPKPEDFIRLLSKWGVDSSTQVVAYDAAAGQFAARLWWLLRYYHHPAVAVLDGGFAKWMTENHPIRSGIEYNQPSQFIGTPDPTMIVNLTDVEKIRRDPGFRLIDARSSSRFIGEGETIDPVGGHINGAVNHFYGINLNPDNTLKDAGTLRSSFEEILGPVGADHTVVYCGSGITATHNILAMEYAGLTGARLYPGSWSEWIRDPERPWAKDPK